jgi:hypothetical protein
MLNAHSPFEPGKNSVFLVPQFAQTQNRLADYFFSLIRRLATGAIFRSGAWPRLLVRRLLAFNTSGRRYAATQR